MKKASLIVLILGFAYLCTAQPSIRILTINVWSGLDYCGEFKFGEFEVAETREERFQSLLHQIRRLNPDVVFLQEANPVTLTARRMEDSLEMDEIHNVCVAGIKFGPFGVPTNLKEGLVILAKKHLSLEKIDAWKLSGSFGLFGDGMTIHFDESNFALVGKIDAGGTLIYLLNVHLSSEVPHDSTLESEFISFLASEGIPSTGLNETLNMWRENSLNRLEEVRMLLSRIKDLPGCCPVIAGGDFNATSSSAEIKLLEDSGKFFNSFLPIALGRQPDGGHGQHTWDDKTNENISYSSKLTNIDGTRKEGYDLVNAFYDRRPRKIDHIFFNQRFQPSDIVFSGIVLDSALGNSLPSDHYGVIAEADLSNVSSSTPKTSAYLTASTESTFEPLPVVSYDTDAGFGYGAKAFLLNYFGFSESFDALLFNSSKGERWYRFVFSIPDFELRQGKIYPISLDLTFDYDKWMKNSFFGLGNKSSYGNREYYTKEPLEISLTASSGFTTSIVAQAGIKHKISRNYNFSNSGEPSRMPMGLSRSTMRATSFFASLMYDSRNSFINPSRGTVLKGEVEVAPDWNLSNCSFVKAGLWFQNHFILFDYPKTIFSMRGGLQEIIGTDLPVQALLSVGGGSSLRGSPQDRYLDKISAILNFEMRFPIYWRFGGIIGLDAGKVWDKISSIDLRRWPNNPAAGIRFYFDTFIVRLDLGFGKETTGFFLNFGHLF